MTLGINQPEKNKKRGIAMKETVKRILVINCGSSSLKYEVYKMPERFSLGRGLVERIGEQIGKISQNGNGNKYELETHIPDHNEAMRLMVNAMTDKKKGFLEDIDEIDGIGHRVVHGGEQYSASVVIDDRVIKAVEDNIHLAPLHNPPNLIGIRAAEKVFGDKKQVGVFDTAFHQTLPPSAYLYGLPREYYDKHKIRRYGFHGTSHRFVANEAMRFLKRSADNTNAISCHLGNGASITAIFHGKSIDTSMGFTPLEGLVMGTRCGDIDPAIVIYLAENLGLSVKEINNILNKKSGLLGLSGISNDLRDIEKAAEEGNQLAQEALDVYAHSIRKYIGAYTANIVKVDVLIFTGGIGQYGVKMRERICHRLENIGIVMDYQRNAEIGAIEGVISTDYSPTTIAVIPTNEELQIAIDTYDLLFTS
jgi:acetate kinase